MLIDKLNPPLPAYGYGTRCATFGCRSLPRASSPEQRPGKVRAGVVWLGQLSSRLGDADWLDDEFSAGDPMITSVLLRLGASGLLQAYPNIAAYIAR